jgi:predicted alpha/beta-hydrolase family hydrolase
MRWSVPVPGGEVPVLADESGGELVVILAHGAGSHMEQKTMEWLAEIVRSSGARVVRFNFLYRALGKGMPDRMPVLVQTYRAVIASVRERLSPGALVIGGHSMGGRTASMLEAEEKTADGLLLFGYPLHPAGQPEKLRDAHLPAIRVPTLQFNGTEDALCTPVLMERALSGLDRWTLHWIAGADHSYAVAKTTGRTRAEVAEEIRRELELWLGSF